MASALIHASAGEPPSAELIIPTGVLYFSWISLAKKNATAENDKMFLGVAICQFPVVKSSFSS